MSTGKIKFFNESKGFGFIINDLDGKEYYYHATGSLDRCETGDKVSFEISENARGIICTNVRRIKTEKNG